MRVPSPAARTMAASRRSVMDSVVPQVPRLHAPPHPARGQRIERWFQVPKTCVLPIGRPPMGHSSVGAMAVADDLDAADEMPRWDLTPLFPGVDSRELAAAQESVGAGLTRLAALYDE